MLSFQHFVCAKCEKPFLGTRHYEKKGLAYCETHYHQLFGNMCFVCDLVIEGDGMYCVVNVWKMCCTGIATIVYSLKEII